MEEEGDYYDDYEILDESNPDLIKSSRQALLQSLADGMAFVVRREIQEQSNFIPESQSLNQILKGPRFSDDLSRIREKILTYDGDDRYARFMAYNAQRINALKTNPSDRLKYDETNSNTNSIFDPKTGRGNNSFPLADEVAAIESLESADSCNFNAVAIRKAMSERFLDQKKSRVLDQGSYADVEVKADGIDISNGDMNKKRLVVDFYDGGHFNLAIWTDVDYKKRRLLKDEVYRSQDDIESSRFYLGIVVEGDDRDLFLPILGSFKIDSGCHVVYPNGSELDGEVYNKHELLQSAKKLLVDEENTELDLRGVLKEVKEASVFQLDVEEHMKQVQLLVDNKPDFVSGVLRAYHYAIPHTLNLDAVGPTELSVIGYCGGIVGRDGKNEIETEFVMTVQTTASDTGNEPSQLIYSVWSGKDPKLYYIDKCRLFKGFELIVDELGNKTLFTVKPESMGGDISIATEEEEELYIRIVETLTIAEDNLTMTKLGKDLFDRR